MRRRDSGQDFSDPESLQHKADCDTVREKIAAHISGRVPIIYDRGGRQPTNALRVTPTGDGTGRVHIPIPYLAALLDTTTERLVDPDWPIAYSRGTDDQL